jgi:uncharacterized protein (DUF433 family)
MKALAVGKHLVIGPRICLGRLSFRGTRLPVATVLAPLLEGRSVKDVLAAWPELTRPAVVEAVKLAAVSWPQLLPEEAAKTVMRLGASLARLPLDPEWEAQGLEPTAKGLFKRPVEIGDYLVIHPGICFGKLTFKGTRVPVQTVLVFIAQGDTLEEIQAGWPRVEVNAVEEAVQLAAASWPELMREPVRKAIRRWAANSLKDRPPPTKMTAEAARPGRTAG